MKYLYYIIMLPLFFILVACSGTDSKTDAFGIGHSAKNPAAKITHEGGWTIISKIENGDRIYWFLAPEVDNVSPAMFKKIIHAKNKSHQETETVSQCDAPKQTCDDLMNEFKSLSENYK